jgi:hypothetical protein
MHYQEQGFMSAGHDHPVAAAHSINTSHQISNMQLQHCNSPSGRCFDGLSLVVVVVGMRGACVTASQQPRHLLAAPAGCPCHTAANA